MRLLVTPPFDSPIAPLGLDLDTELAPILAEYGITVVTDPAQADLELVGNAAGVDPALCHLPRSRVVLIDGEPPQPEYLLPHYTQTGYAAVLTPANLKVFDPDCMSYYIPPQATRPVARPKSDAIVQLATWRERDGNANDGSHLVVNINGRQLFCYRVLCNLRALVGLNIKQLAPEVIDVYGRGWPPGVAVVENSRGRVDFLELRHEIVSRYAFDLCWENMEIPHWVSEKFWSPVRMGTLPLYWGPSDFHRTLPPDTVVDCRAYLGGEDYDLAGLLYDVANMSDEEYRRRVETLLDWYYEIPADAGKVSVTKAAHQLARDLLAV